MKILFAEDLVSIAMPIISHLEIEGWNVVHVKDGISAVDAFSTDNFDLIILDVFMPGMGGIDVCKKIKSASGANWIPVILLTVLSGDDDIVCGLDAGADEFISKPVKLPVLSAKVRSLSKVGLLQRTLHNVLDGVFEGVVTIDEDGCVLSFSDSACKTFGYSKCDALGENIGLFFNDGFDVVSSLYACVQGGNDSSMVVGGRRKSGELFVLKISVVEGCISERKQLILFLLDLSAEEDSKARLEYLATYDGLTGLPRREKLLSTLESIMHNSSSTVHALIFIDLDGFKSINDGCGHVYGDVVLKEVATRLRSAVGFGGMIVRYGGDEFLVFLRDVSGVPMVKSTCESLMHACTSSLACENGNTIRLTASIGAVTFGNDFNSCQHLIDEADRAMYIAKKSGRGCFFIAPIDKF